MLGYSYSITRAPSRGKKEGDLVAWWEEHANDRHRFHSMFADLPSRQSIPGGDYLIYKYSILAGEAMPVLKKFARVAVTPQQKDDRDMLWGTPTIDEDFRSIPQDERLVVTVIDES